MPGRNFNSNSYRYGAANGQEKVDEISGSGNHYAAEFWEYDPRTKVRWNIDPITKSFESPYSVYGRNPILMIDPNGADWFKGENGDVKWHDARGKSGEQVSLKGLEGTWTNLGQTYEIKTDSYIPESNDLPLPLRPFVDGSKLLTTIGLTGNYDDKGKFTNFTYTYERKVGATGDIDALQGTETVPGKTNSPAGNQANGIMHNNRLNIETHTTTPDIETFGLNVMGSNVDVNQQMSISISANGSLNVNISHGTYPSVTMTGKGNGQKSSMMLYQYQAQSFMFTHGTRYIPMLFFVSKIGAIEQSYRSYQFQKSSNILNAGFRKTNKAKFGGFNAGQ